MVDPLRETIIAEPEWFKGAALDAERTFRLINSDSLPVIFRGNFTVHTCLRLLRCVFGVATNAEAIQRLQYCVTESADYWRRQTEIDDAKN